MLHVENLARFVQNGTATGTGDHETAFPGSYRKSDSRSDENPAA